MRQDDEVTQRQVCLVVPATSPAKLQKAAQLDVDQVVIDLEDALVAAEKDNATRDAVLEVLASHAIRAPLVSVRVNGVDTEWFDDDMDALLTGAGPALSSIVVPKVERADQLITVSELIEDSVAAPYGIRLEALIETARGVVNVEAIAGSTDKLDALIFGPGDYAASLGLPLADIGAIDPDYPGDQWAYPRARIAVAAHAFGLVPIDGPYARYRDIEGFRESAKRARALGFVGRWVIHPDQVGPCREAFGTSSDELVAAERTLDALRSTGVASIDDAMVDAVSARMAEQAVQRSRAGDG